MFKKLINFVKNIFIKKENIVNFVEKYCKITTLDKGLQQVKLEEFQKDILNKFVNNDNIVHLACRRSTKTTLLLLYLTYYIKNNNNKRIGLIVPRISFINEIKTKFLTIINNLPKSLNITLKNVYEKEIIINDNKISFITNKNSLNGMLFDLLLGDEFDFANKDFQEACLNFIRSNKTILSSTLSKINKDVEEMTPFSKIYQNAINKINNFTSIKTTVEEVANLIGVDDELKKMFNADQWKTWFECEFKE